MASPKPKLKLSLADVGNIVGVQLPLAVALWPGVRAKLKAMKDDPDVAAFVAAIEDIYKRATT
jgi:hypothetical protein